MYLRRLICKERIYKGCRSLLHSLHIHDIVYLAPRSMTFSIPRLFFSNCCLRSSKPRSIFLIPSESLGLSCIVASTISCVPSVMLFFMMPSAVCLRPSCYPLLNSHKRSQSSLNPPPHTASRDHLPSP